MIAPTWGDQPRTWDQMADRVDELLARRWDDEYIEPNELAGDAQFLRRASLDLHGVVPAIAEVRRFLEDPNPDKREELIERLLSSPRYAAHMAVTWRDLLLPGDFDPAQLDQAADLERWLRRQFQQNLRYDRLVSAFLAASGDQQDGPALYYRALGAAPEKLAASTSRIFLGIEIECAQCHDHPFDQWKQRDFWGYAAFFARLQRPDDLARGTFRLVDLDRGEVTLPDSDQVVPPRYPGGTPTYRDEGGSRRVQLSIWMASRDNPFLGRAAVNRVWALLFGRGLVHPVDDMSPQNLPSHPELLDELSEYFVQTGFDLKNLFRVLAHTRAYQRSSRQRDDDGRGAELFARMAHKTMTAEQLYNCMRRVIGSEALSDGEDTDDLRQMRLTFVARLASLARDRLAYEAGVQQALVLMNGPLTARATHWESSSLLAALDAPLLTDVQRIDILYLATLCRYPSDQERDTILQLAPENSNADQRHEWTADLLWALLNSSEFAIIH